MEGHTVVELMEGQKWGSTNAVTNSGSTDGGKLRVILHVQNMLLNCADVRRWSEG